MPDTRQLFSMVKNPNQASIPAHSGVEKLLLATYFRQEASAWPSVRSLNHETLTGAHDLMKLLEGNSLNTVM